MNKRTVIKEQNIRLFFTPAVIIACVILTIVVGGAVFADLLAPQSQRY